MGDDRKVELTRRSAEEEKHMKRNRILALLLAGCMVIGNGNVLLYAEESDEQLFTIEEDEESEIQEDVMTELVAEGDDLKSLI